MSLTTGAIVALIVAVLVLYYPVSCWIFPMRDCWCCKGAGHHRPPGDDKTHRRGKVSRPCRWCHSSGKRWRIGRRVWNRLRRAHKAAR